MPVATLTPWRVELGRDVRAELGIDGREDRRELLDDGDADSAVGQRVAHLDTDVTGSDDDGTTDVAGLELPVDLEAVLHRVQDVHAR